MSKFFMGILFSITVLAFSCKPKDADIATEAQKVMPAEARVQVTDGVAILTGEFKDEAAKKNAEETLAKVKGVKSVINNATIIQPTVKVEVDVATDNILNQGINAAIKDYKMVKAQVNNGVVTLTGEINKVSLPKLMMAINALKPRKIENKLIIK